jgi:histidine triad (HIT) family protein|tara:strand:+ start:2307 stop:2696 length:390 start_codon:yes stop_codon:yes gene_type:complete
MSSIFKKIIDGEIPAHKVAESDKHLAFLDIQPLRKGHVLVIPKKETDNIFDIEDNELGELMIFAKTVAKKIAKEFPCRKVGVAVVGLEVPHAHVHLIPINQVSDMDFKQAKLNLSNEELASIAERLSKA